MLPKHWWEGTDARAASATSPRPRWRPAGSGPYRIKEFVAGRSLALERVKDYWGKELPPSIGQNNSTSSAMNISAMTPLVARSLQGGSGRLDRAQRQGLVHRLRLPGGERKARDPGGISDSQFGGMQALGIQYSPSAVRGARMRRAFNFAFDFEEMNRTTLYRRIQARQQLF